MASTRGAICLVTPEFLGLTRNGGIGVSYSLLANLLAQSGWRVHVLYCGTDTNPEALQVVRQQLAPCGIGFTNLDDVPIPLPLRVHSGFPPVNSIDRSDRVQAALTELHEQERFDLIQFPDWLGLGFRPVQAQRTRLAFDDVGTIVKLHGMSQWAREHNSQWPANPDVLIHEFAEQHSFEHAHFQTSASRYALDYARRIGWRVRDDAEVVPNPLAEPKSLKQAPSDDTLPELVYFGRLETRKGLKLFVQAVKGIDPSLKLTFLGRDLPLECGQPASRWVQTQLAERNVCFLTHYDRDQALTYLASGNRLAIIPSLSETFCHTVAECMVHGIPFLASGAAAIPELIQDPELQARLLFQPSATHLKRCLSAYLQASSAERHAWSTKLLEGANVATHNRRIVESYERCLQASHRLRAPRLVNQGPDQPLVTVAVIHYNLGAYLPATLASIAAQTYPNLDVVVIDDGSTEPTSVQAFEEQAQRYPHFSFIRQANAGLGAARNRALAEAKGVFFCPLDADDIASPHMIEHLVAALQANPNSSVINSYLLAFEQGPQRAQPLFAWAYRATGGPLAMGCLHNVHGHASGLFRTRDLRAAGGYDERRGVIMEDWHLYVKLACLGHAIEIIPEHLLYYRLRRDSMLRTGDPFPGRLRIIDAYAQAPPSSLADQRAVWTALMSLHMSSHAHLETVQLQLSCLRYRCVDKINGLMRRIPFLHRWGKNLALLLIAGWRRWRDRRLVHPQRGHDGKTPHSEQSPALAPSSPAPQPSGAPIDLADWALEITGARVLAGPFRGMRYIRRAHGSVLIPKLLGSYERELHPFLAEIVQKHYACVLNIGSAEGYYSVGLAVAMPEINVFAYDRDPAARQSLTELARLNGVADRVTIQAECDHTELARFAGRRVLIVCDIEGSEDALLDPDQVPALRGFDLLVELHDGEQSRRLHDLMRARFGPTHALAFVRYTGRTVHDIPLAGFPTHPGLVDEERQLGIEWVFMQRRAQIQRPAA